MNNKILIINHNVWHHTKKSHLPIIAKGLERLLNKESSNCKVVNTNVNTLRREMINNCRNSRYKAKYIIVYGAEIKMLENFLNSYLILSLKLRYIIYFGIFLVNESPKGLDNQLNKYMKGNIRFFVDSYMLQKALKHKTPYCFPFLNKELFNKINNESKTRKNTVFINLRKLSYPFMVKPSRYNTSLLYGLINLIQKNQDHYFYVDNQINRKLIDIFRDNLRNIKNWKFINPSDDYEQYLKDKREVEKHIMLLVSWNRYRTSGNILEMVGLNRMIIIVGENNWACNFLNTIQYPNTIYVKSFFNLPLKDLPEIKEYNFYDQFINSHSIGSMLNLIPEAKKRLQTIKEGEHEGEDKEKKEQEHV